MEHFPSLSRRGLLRRFVLGLSLAPVLAAAGTQASPTGAGSAGQAAGGAALLDENDPAARAVHYVADVQRARDAQPGSNCSNCSLYGGASGAAQGPCSLFPGRLVKAAGWCSSWATL